MPAYLAENYRDLHAERRCGDRAPLGGLPRSRAGSLERSVEIGTGPNLYPLFLASGAARHIDAVDRSAGRARLPPAAAHRGPGPDLGARSGSGAVRSTPPCRRPWPRRSPASTRAGRRLRARRRGLRPGLHALRRRERHGGPGRVRGVLRGVRGDRPAGRPSRRGVHGEHGPVRARATARAGRASRSTARPWRGCSARSPRICGSRGSTPTRGCRRTATPGWC